METAWKFLQKLNVELPPYDPEMPPRRVHPKELKTGTQTVICTPIFIIFFTITKGGKTQYPSIDEQINKIWYIHIWNIIQPQKGVKFGYRHVTDEP